MIWKIVLEMAIVELFWKWLYYAAL